MGGGTFAGAKSMNAWGPHEGPSAPPLRPDPRMEWTLCGSRQRAFRSFKAACSKSTARLSQCRTVMCCIQVQYACSE